MLNQNKLHQVSLLQKSVINATLTCRTSAEFFCDKNIEMKRMFYCRWHKSEHHY